MKVKLNKVSVFAVLAGVISFTFLVAALATDFWYQIDASGLEGFTNLTGSVKFHRGLWRTCQYLHGAFVVLLPLSLIIIILGGMAGILSIFTQAFCLMLFTGVLFLLGALVTLLGVNIYIAYSAALFKHVASFQGRKKFMENLNIQFGWSLAFVWVSIGADLLTGLAFILMAKMVGQKRRWDNFI
ncbi:PREDICTED: transmembrane protein 114-like isoform X2 [Thamnophis sirtalis]|uniref:Transmembrane protein 114-like isoform X2 n=1 Tax=Thamnophis sirtalis TaxID=35019 RepID=A0A6I9YI67_9SAUR|nr:PREDICTED: transmembrane protein 114-like isoform X2 [Thamnophis sirtalis]